MVGVYSLEEYHRWIEPRAGAWSSKLAARVIAALPACGANLVASLYALARRHRLLLDDLSGSRFHYRRCWARLFKPGPKPTPGHSG